MTTAALTLIAISAVMHAGWNLSSKSHYASVAGLYVATLMGTLCVLPLLGWYADHLHAIPPAVWRLAPLSGLALAVYYVALANAYRTQDVSRAYPLARSLPVVIVPVVTTAIAQGGPISARAWCGFGLIVAGAIMLPWKHWRDVHHRHYLSPAYLWAVAAALGTTGYSVLDDRALRLLQQAEGWTATSASLVYLALEAAASAGWLSLVVIVSRHRRAQAMATLGHAPGHALTTGIVIYLSYALVLIAMNMTTNVGYVVALRQLSIPLGAIGAVLLLREPCPQPRAVGVATLCADLLLAALG